MQVPLQGEYSLLEGQRLVSGLFVDIHPSFFPLPFYLLPPFPSPSPSFFFIIYYCLLAPSSFSSHSHFSSPVPSSLPPTPPTLSSFSHFFSVSLPSLYFVSHTLQTDQGIKNLSVDRAAYLSGVDPDYSLKDLYEAIANRNFVSSLVPRLLLGGEKKSLVSTVRACA